MSTKLATFTAGVAAALLLAACGGDSDAQMSTPPGSTPTTPPPVTSTAFNGYVLGLAAQQDAASERDPPARIEELTFTFDDDNESAFASILPAP